MVLRAKSRAKRDLRLSFYALNNDGERDNDWGPMVCVGVFFVVLVVAVGLGEVIIIRAIKRSDKIRSVVLDI